MIIASDEYKSEVTKRYWERIASLYEGVSVRRSVTLLALRLLRLREIRDPQHKAGKNELEDPVAIAREPAATHIVYKQGSQNYICILQ